MRKIIKIINIAIIFMIIGVFLGQNPVWSGETSLRVPSSFQDRTQNFPKKFNTIAATQKVLEGPFQVPGTDIYYKVYEMTNPVEIKETLYKWFAAKKERYFETLGEWSILISAYVLYKMHPNVFLVKLESEKGEILGLGFFHKEDKFMFSQDIQGAKQDISAIYFFELMEVSEGYRNKGLGEVLVAKVIERSMKDPDIGDRIFLAEPASKGKHSAVNFLKRIGARPIYISREEELFSGPGNEEIEWRTLHYILYREQAEELLRKVLSNAYKGQANSALLQKRISIQSKAIEISL